MALTNVAQVQRGMGAIVHKGGVAFRVWAPNAQAVFVKGDFNDWSDSTTPLSHEENGYWYADVASAKACQEYKYVLINGDQKLERIDPYARQVTNSSGNGVIYDPSGFDWENDNFELPPHNELVIYEMHIGSFFADEKGQPGDFATAMEKMGHLKRIGVMPFR
jgi:1,4-alpha-glucan branching enzyme